MSNIVQFDNNDTISFLFTIKRSSLIWECGPMAELPY